MATEKKNSEKENGGVSREQLLELQVLNQKAGRIMAQLEAIGQRKAALSLEMNIIPEKERQLQAQRDEVVGKLREAYAQAKFQANVPEGMELDIETGNPVKPPQAEQQA